MKNLGIAGWQCEVERRGYGIIRAPETNVRSLAELHDDGLRIVHWSEDRMVRFRRWDARNEGLYVSLWFWSSTRNRVVPDDVAIKATKVQTTASGIRIDLNGSEGRNVWR